MPQLNMDLMGPLDVGEDQMSVVITGGHWKARSVAKEVVFGALEGAGFAHVDYIPDHKEQMPSMNVTSLLEECRILNPELFDTHITVETAEKLFEPDGVNQLAWEHAQQGPSNGEVKSIEIDGKLLIRF
jgi:hypothetical protein